MISGLRNKDLDLQPLIYPPVAKSEPESRRRSTAISRKPRLLRGRHLIRKVPGTHRYQVTEAGRQIYHRGARRFQRHRQHLHSQISIMNS